MPVKLARLLNNKHFDPFQSGTTLQPSYAFVQSASEERRYSNGRSLYGYLLQTVGLHINTTELLHSSVHNKLRNRTPARRFADLLMLHEASGSCEVIQIIRYDHVFEGPAAWNVATQNK
jgi:hypothetical protein